MRHAGRAGIARHADVARGEDVVDTGAGIEHAYGVSALEIVSFKPSLCSQPGAVDQDAVERVSVVMLAQHQGCLQRVSGGGVEIPHDDPRRRHARCHAGQRLGLCDSRARIGHLQVRYEHSDYRPVHVHLRFQRSPRLGVVGVGQQVGLVRQYRKTADQGVAEEAGAAREYGAIRILETQLVGDALCLVIIVDLLGLLLDLAKAYDVRALLANEISNAVYVIGEVHTHSGVDVVGHDCEALPESGGLISLRRRLAAGARGAHYKRGYGNNGHNSKTVHRPRIQSHDHYPLDCHLYRKA